MSGNFGQTIKEEKITEIFLSSPGQDLVAKTLLQLSSIENATGKAFQQLFGAYKPGSNQQRWADYARYDWSVRQLPVINVYEAEGTDKTSSNGFVNGTINVMVLWPPSARRSDWARVPMAFQGALQNFFESDAVRDMLDEIYWVERPAKVAGLNEYGKVMTWTPNVEGMVESEMVPVTLVSIKYRIDLRAWYRALEFQNRTKGQPFVESLADLTKIAGEYQGKDKNETEVVLPDEIPVSSS